MVKTEVERLAILETHMTDQDQKLNDIQSDIREIKISLNIQADLKHEISDLKEELITLKKMAWFWRWLSPTLAAAFGSVLTILIISYIDKLR